jgi:TonB family protein
MIVMAALLLGAVGWGVDAVVRKVQEQLPPPARASAPAPRPSPGPEPGTGPAPVTKPEDEALRRMHEEFERQMADVKKDLAEAEAEPIGGNVKPPVALQSPAPQYTETARRARVQGVVILEATVSREGKVVSTRVLKGLPMGLDEAAREAVAQWRFEPATKDGEPVAVIMTLTVNFRLE